MASYNSGYDPPTKPGDKSGSRIPASYIQPGSSSRRPENKGAGTLDSRRGQGVGERSPHQTSLPRSGMRDTPSSTGQPPESTGPRTGTASRFGFSKSNSRGDSAVPELRTRPSRNVLRRKPSVISQHPGNTRSIVERTGSTSPTKWSPGSPEQRPSIEASMRSMDAYNDIFTRTGAKPSAVKKSPRIIPELDRYGTRSEHLTGLGNRSHEVPKLATQDLPPPTPSSVTPGASGISGGSGGSGGSGASWATPMYPPMNNNHNRYSGYSGYSGSGYSASPSTRFSESPGPSSYSRDTTPTSMASQSPGLMVPAKIHTPRLRQGSPALTRPPVTRRRAGSTSTDGDGLVLDTQGLSSLQESITSSSSNSTVKGGGNPKTPTSTEKKKTKKGLSPLPPSPPPRKSSQKSTQLSPTKKPSTPKATKSLAQAVGPSPVETPLLDPPTVFSHQRNGSNSSNGSTPPRRPSRQGTPNLQSQLGGSIPVIQSNLSSVSSVQDNKSRRQSTLSLTNSASAQKQSLYQSQTGSRLTSRNPSPAPTQFASGRVDAAPSGLGIIPNLRPVQTHPGTTSSSATRTPSPAVSNPRQRFGLFSRRTKTAPAEIPTIGSKEKVPRKGPAAGTGHEGYGKYGLRGRSSIVNGATATRNRSTSAASSAESVASSTRTHDPFLLDRMSPVIIAGGGEILENRNTSSELTRTESGTSFVLSTKSAESKSSLSLGQESSRSTLWPSALPREPTKGTPTIGSKARRPSDSSDDWTSQPSSLAFRRSMQRINHSTSQLSLPKPLNLTNMGASPSLRSLESSLMESSIMSDESHMDSNIEQGRGRKVLKAKPKKLEKRTKSPRKWNLFHRSRPKEESQVAETLPVTIGRQPVKAVPHYALLDSSDEQQDEQMDIADILRDAEVTQLSDQELDALQFTNYKENLKRIEDLKIQMDTQAPLSLPERSPMIFSSPESMHSTPELMHLRPHVSNESTPPSAPEEDITLHFTQDAAPVRPSRLLQVGRIPKVMSARPEATSPKSFSRPFARLSALQPIQGPIVIDKDSLAMGADPLESLAPEQLTADAEPNVAGSRQDSKSSTCDSTQDKQFFAFSPRKNSEATTISSSVLSFAGTTAVIPAANAALEVDEIWDEYDDLIQNPAAANPRLSATSSHGMPFQYENYESRKMSGSESQPKDVQSSQLTPTTKGSSTEDTLRSSQVTTSSMHSLEMATRMKALLVAVPSPKAQMEFTDTTPRQPAGRSERRRKRRPSQSSPRKSGNQAGPGSATVPVKQQDNASPISQVNLRVGSMTVSKWLTFGHVLFSPAREEIMHLEDSANAPSILVIDGLGNGMSH